MVRCDFSALASGRIGLLSKSDFRSLIGWGAMNKFFAIVCSLLLALSVAGCAGKGKAPVGKGKAPPPVVTKG
jgi:hypothetical protein